MTLPGEHPTEIGTSDGRQIAQVVDLQRQVDAATRALATNVFRGWVLSASAGMADSTWVKAPLVALEDPLGMISSQTVVIKKAGLWLISGHVSISNPTNAGTVFRAQLTRTSPSAFTQTPYSHIGGSPAGSWSREVPLATTLIRVNNGDVLELQGQQVGGGTASTIGVGTHLDMLWFGP